MTLIEVGSHAIVGAVFGTESEQVLAAWLAPALTAAILLLGDRERRLSCSLIIDSIASMLDRAKMRRCRRTPRTPEVLTEPNK